MGLENVVDLVFFMTVFPQLVESQLLQPCLNPFFAILEKKKNLTLFESMLVLRVFTFTYMLWLISLIILKFP